MMLSWIQEKFGRRPAATPPALPPPQWACELAEALQKSSRAQARVGVRLEDLDRKLEGGFGELRASVASGAQSQEPRWDDLFDAMDLLEEAARVALGDPGLEQGLRAVLARLDRFLSQRSLVRCSSRGAPVDGKLFRVVGTQQEPDLPEGVVARVVRAAIVRGDQLVREGEVLTNRRHE